MNEIIEKEVKIENMIYEIRGKQVMLDSDLAKLFGYETKNLNRQVQRNINRFPINYCFQLTKEEYKNLRCQNVTSSISDYGGRRYLPYVFTEHGVTMLAGILKSDIAIKMSLKVVDTFVEMRKYISTNLIEQKYINNQVIKNTEDIKLLRECYDKLKDTKNNNGLFFEGQIYDAYSLLLDIFNQAKESIIIIDNYIDKNILDILRKTKKDILIVTNKFNNEDFNKYQKQYNNVKIKINNKIHDRFIIIDKCELYHSGSSLKDVGKKCFALTKIEDSKWLDKVLELI